MIKKKFVLPVIMLVCLCCIGLGCGKKPDDKQVVAKVNDFVMTVADLKEEIENAPYAAKNAQNLEEILDLAVKKQILIQEAQRQGLHLKSSFMKTIERYWEQTLIRELLREENEQVFASGVPADLRNKTLDENLDKIYKKADVKVYKRVLSDLEKK
ncbi:MAG: hypothetical protein JW869_03290 [Candidatus Omnitrophica bacterium]|nr:hypothetical protein [Candidatus Omnitrophota bacterium]